VSAALGRRYGEAAVRRRPGSALTPDLVIMAAVFAMPVAAGMVGAGAIAKLTYPVAIALLAVALAAKNAPRYLQLLIWTFSLSPGLRHYVEWDLGYSQSDPIMLAPFLVVAAATPSVLLHFMSMRRYAVPGVTLLALIVFGSGITLVTGDLHDALVTGVRWLSPVWVAFYIIAHARQLPAMRRAVLAAFAVVLPAASVYGIVQFAVVEPWDAAFMRAAPYSEAASFGYPWAFGVRVFGTMNSPGSLAAMLTTGILLLLPCARRFFWFVVLIGFATLLLTTQRAAEGGLVAGTLAAVLVSGDRRVRRGVGGMVLVLVLAGGVLMMIPETGAKLERTYNSVTNIQKDNSAQERSRQYANLVPMLDGQMLGRGIGWADNRIYLTGDRASLDSGLIDVMVALGVPGGVLFLGTLFWLMAHGVQIARRGSDSGAAMEAAAAVCGLVQLPMGSQHTGEHGVFLFLGLLLAREALPVPAAPALSPARLRG
jgi:hypothetical protein